MLKHEHVFPMNSSFWVILVTPVFNTSGYTMQNATHMETSSFVFELFPTNEIAC